MDAPYNQYQGLRSCALCRRQCSCINLQILMVFAVVWVKYAAMSNATFTFGLQPCCVLPQTVAQHVAQMDYMRHAMKTKDGEIEVLKKKWQEYQEVQDRLSGYEKDRLGEKDLLRKRAEQIDALQHKVTTDRHCLQAQPVSAHASLVGTCLAAFHSRLC